jgi:hypothetical protein
MKIKDIVEEYLIDSVDAQLFFYSYLIHCHAVDDVIDGDRTDSEFIIKCFDFTVTLCSCRFYQHYSATLEPLMHAAANAYADSVVMERSKVQWKQQYADVLRQSGNEVLLACIGIVAGIDKKREASLKLRELAYLEHHDKEGKPI